MSTATLPAAARPLPKLPNNAHTSFVWRGADGRLDERDVEMPVDPKTHRINGRVFACPTPECSTGEWVIEPAQGPRNRHCPADGNPLIEMPLDDTQPDPISSARQRMLARISRHVADKRDAAAARIRAVAAKQVAEARRGVRHLGAEMYGGGLAKGHLPSLAATTTIEIGVVYVADLAQPLESLALAAAIGTWGALLGYLLAIIAQKQWARWVTKEPLAHRALSAAHRRSLYAGKALAGTGVLFGALGTIDGLVGLDLTSGWQAALVGVLGLGLAWLVNRDHWDRLWAARRRIRELAEEAALRAAAAEADRLAAEAQRLREEARLRDELAQVGALDPDNPLHQGERMRIEWERIARLETAILGFPKIGKTRIVPDQTREITAPDPVTGTRVRIGWEYLGTCEPGALVANGAIPPVLAAKEWIVSVLFGGELEAANVSLIDKPGGRQNTFLIMVTERARLGDAVPWRADRAVHIEADGTRYGYLGRALTGDDLDEILYTPGQAFGGMVTGTTGGGKGGYAIRHILNLLLAGILPILFDPKQLVDYADFVGIFPIGFTKRHRRIILTSLHLERERRQKVLAQAPKTNKYGAQVAGESRWSTHDPHTGEIGVFGQPIEHIWDEFHDLAKDDKFLLDLTNHMRFQRAAAIGATLLSQGGGLEDWGNSVLRDLAGLVALTNFRSSDMQSRLAGQRNADYSTADLPMLPGMCLRRAPGTPQVPLRAAYITREADADDTVFTTLWGKGTEPQLQIPNPMDWISDETKELWETTGLMQLWRLAQGPGGLQALLADTAEDEEDDDEQAFIDYGRQIAKSHPKEVVPKQMQVREILLAILFETPGLDRDGILASDGWARAGRPVPDPATISRAAGVLDPTKGGELPLQPGMIKKIDRGAGSKSWTVTPEATPEAAEMAARLAPRLPQHGASFAAPGSMMPPGMSTAATVEMAAARAAEMAQQIAAEQAKIMAAEARR